MKDTKKIIMILAWLLSLVAVVNYFGDQIDGVGFSVSAEAEE